jgi:tetratricopeptide (TPR) repeat protein
MNPRVVAALIVACLAILVFIPSITAEFLSWDDYDTLVKNPHFNPPPDQSIDIGYYWANPHMDLYAPLTYTIWGLLAGQAHTDTPDPDTGSTLNPMVFHAINILLHAAAALVVLQLLELIFENIWVCAAGAALFAIHPIQVEPVAWVSGMKDVLAGLLGLIALWQYLRFAKGISSSNVSAAPAAPAPEPVPVPAASVEGESQPPEGEEESAPIEVHISPVGSYVIATICFALAMLAKPSAIAIPFVAIVLDCLVARRRFSDAIKPLVIWFVLTIPVLWIAWTSQPATHTESPILARPLVMLDSLAFYIYKVLVPARYALDYGRSPGWLLASAQNYWTWIVPVALAIVCIATYRKFHWLAIGSLIFAAALIPVLGLFRFDFQIFSSVADRYVYLAMLGPAIILAGALALWNSDVGLRVAGVVIVLLALRSFVQVRTWNNNETVFEHTLAVNPNSVAANNSLGVLWSGRAEQARLAAQRALAERNEEAYRLNMQQAAEADAKSLSHYLASARIKPNDPTTQFNLGNSMLAQGKHDEAAKYYQHALQNVMDSPEPKTDAERYERQSKIALYNFNLGSMYGIMKQPEKAIEYFKKSVDAVPTAAAETNWGIALNALGKPADAKKHFLNALDLNPNDMRAKQYLFRLTTQPSTRLSSTTTAPATTKTTTAPAPQ